MNKNEFDYDNLTKELIICHNQIRKDPLSFIPKLELWKKKFRDNTLYLFNENPLKTYEGIKGVEEAIRFLRYQKPVPELLNEKELNKAAQDHAVELGQYGLIGHDGLKGSSLPDRIERYIEWEGACAENLDFGFSTAENIILNLLIDDGSPDRDQRSNLFSTVYKYFGVGAAKHKVYSHCSVFVYVKHIRDLGQPPNVGINFMQDYIQKTFYKKIIVNRFQEQDPDAPDDTVSIKITKCTKNILGKEKKITKKIYTLKDKTQHILEIEEN